MRTISIAKDFSPFPGGRTPADGPDSGEVFRNKFLFPLFSTTEQVEINFDGVWGYGSSFLDEAFGGLVRCGIPKEKVLQQLIFISKKESIVEEVRRYINDASV